ncbi:MAG TPA: HAD-IIB family hydrolase [Polyangiales bacterium]|nr:HAD-IIB family hydrolase [Polyangiales bacterium]
MDPIRTIEPEVCKALRGVVFDVDDTLTRGGRLEALAYDALWQLRDAGLALIAVTGRPLGFAEWLARTFPLELAVGENGAGYVRATEHGVTTGYVDDASSRAQQRATLDRVRARVARELPWARESDDSWARRCDLAYDIGEHERVSREKIAQLVALFEAEGTRAVVSSVHAHAAASDCDKARGVVHAARVELAQDLAAERERWLFVGDSANDAAAFAHFRLSAGVANVRDHLHGLPVPPRFVSDADRGRGFAEIARAVLERR